MKKYKAVELYTREEAEAVFAQGTSDQIIAALLGVTYYEEDWRWVQSSCLTLLNASDINVQWMAIICLGHLATFHGMLDLVIVLPALQAHASDPDLAGALYDAFDDISSMITRNTPIPAENWDELLQGLKEALIEDEIFDNRDLYE